MTVDISQVPKTLGVYAWKNKYGKVIYVGKTKDLKTTMNQYLTGNLTPKNKVLLGNIDSFEIFKFKTEDEALEKEQELINMYEPIFNIKIRSTKIYPYIEIRKGEKLAMSVSKTKKATRHKFFGPFPNGKIAREVIELWKAIFDTDNVKGSKEQDKIIEKIDDFYKGELDFAYRILEEGNFENKEFLLSVLTRIDNNTEVLFDDKRNLDVINYFVYDDLISVTITYVRKGVKGISANIINKMFTPFPEDAMIAFLSRYYSRNPIPDCVLIPFEADWNINIESTIRTPKSDVEHRLINDTLIHAESELMGTPEQFLDRIKEYAHAIEFMRMNFDTKSSTQIIEMIKLTDFSDHKLVTIAQYLDGQPRLKGFKRYFIDKDMNIKDALTIHLKEQRKKYNVEPDVIILENEAELNIVKDMFKDDASKSLITPLTNGVIINALMNDEGEKIDIEFNSHIYNFLSTIKRELDRFTNAYHHGRTSDVILESKLDKFKFLNEIDKQKLFKTFKSYKRIMAATSEELGKVLSRTKASKLLKERGEDHG